MRALLPLALLCALLLPAASLGQGDESSKTAQQILADVSRDVATLHSYHLTGTETDRHGKTARLTGDIDARGPLRFTTRLGAASASLIALGSTTYVRANRTFWRHEEHIKNPKVLKLLSGRWVKVPGGGDSLRKELAPFAPSTIAHCLSVDTEAVTKRGTTTFAGHRVVVLASKGDKPGTSPGLLYVTTAGRILPLRVVQTGRQRPGHGADPQCDSSDTTTTHADATLSRFDKPLHIGAPAKALDFGKGTTPS